MRPEITRAVRFCAVILAALLALAGCTSSGPSPDPTKPTTPVQTAPPTQPTAPDRPVTPTTPDPHASIRADVLSLDPCALLDPQVAQGYGMQIEPRDPYVCKAATNADDPTRVLVETWVDFPQSSRYSSDRVDIGGLVAYRSTSPNADYCFIFVPVNYDHAIWFQYWPGAAATPAATNDMASCEAAKLFVAAMAQKLLVDPGALRRPVGSRDALDACAILGAIVGPTPPDMEIGPTTDLDSGLAKCGLGYVPESGDIMDWSVDLEMSYQPPVAELAAQRDEDELRSVAGRDVLVSSPDSPGECDLTWDAHPSVDVPGRMLSVTLSITDCREADQWLAKAFAAIDAATPAVSTGAQVLIASGESDAPVSGVCLDVADPVARRCLPAVATDQPRDAKAMLNAGITQPDVLCTATATQVSELFDRQFAAATVVDSGELGCEFVIADHSLVVTVRASTKNIDELALTYNQVPDTVGDFPGFLTKGGPQRIQRTIAVALSESGPSLTITVRAQPSRTLSISTGTQIDASAVDSLDDTAVDLVEAILA